LLNRPGVYTNATYRAPLEVKATQLDAHLQRMSRHVFIRRPQKGDDESSWLNWLNAATSLQLN
jgi:hypothetical protein